MKFSQVGIGLAVVLSVGVSVQAEDIPETSAEEDQKDAVGQTIVQIGGRFCEYYREEVEGALRRFPAVQAVEFLNNHGTVLVRYRTDDVPPVQLAAAVEQALASGIGCKAWVERGGAPQVKS